MELLLNAIWLAIALGSLFVWRRHWQPEIRGSRRSTRYSFIALVCALALLFPAISLTDDLHPAVVSLSDTKSSYAIAHGHSAPTPGLEFHSASHVFAGPVQSNQFRIGLSPVAMLLARNPSVLRIEPCHGPNSGRAPPSFS